MNAKDNRDGGIYWKVWGPRQIYSIFSMVWVKIAWPKQMYFLKPNQLLRIPSNLVGGQEFYHYSQCNDKVSALQLDYLIFLNWLDFGSYYLKIGGSRPPGSAGCGILTFPFNHSSMILDS